MPSVDDLSVSKYLKQSDVDPAVDVTITGYRQVNMAKDNAAPEMKYVLDFQELDKPLTLNKINGQRIKVFTGTGDFDGWIGKRVQLYRDPLIEFSGDIVGGIRVRAVGQAEAVAAAPAPAIDDLPFP
jgi:hypothetical protein